MASEVYYAFRKSYFCKATAVESVIAYVSYAVGDIYFRQTVAKVKSFFSYESNSRGKNYTVQLITAFKNRSVYRLERSGTIYFLEIRFYKSAIVYYENALGYNDLGYVAAVFKRVLSYMHRSRLYSIFADDGIFCFYEIFVYVEYAVLPVIGIPVKAA